MNWKEDVKKLIIGGHESQNFDFIILLKRAAAEDPEFLFSTILVSLENNSDGMLMPAVAAFLCSANEKYLHDRVLIKLFDLLQPCDVDELILLVDLIRSKVFGRGLGSRPQKLIRRVMESWTEQEIKNNITQNIEAFIDLLKLIHPRYQGTKAELIKKIK